MIFWMAMFAEILTLVFVIIYWKSLQTTIEVPKTEVFASSWMGNPLVLGFVRALAICLVPLVVYLLFALASRILFSRSLKFGGFELSEAAEKLDRTEERIQEAERKYGKLVEFNTELQEENATLVKMIVQERFSPKGG